MDVLAGPANDKPGDPIQAIFHYYTPEVHIIQSGGGVLTTRGVIDNFKPGAGVPNVMNGPNGGGVFGRGAYSRRVGPRDIIIIPAGVEPNTDHVDYLGIRRDPEKVLPAGWIYPLLLRTIQTKSSRTSDSLAPES